MKLLCDHMLGSLARWLRFMGYDTAYPPPGPDRELVDRLSALDMSTDQVRGDVRGVELEGEDAVAVPAQVRRRIAGSASA